MKTKRKDKIINKQKQKNYVSNWNIADGKKQYDALDDVFASYYFANPNVKKHLKHFNKIAKKQPQTSDLLRMTFLLEHKYKKSVSRDEKYSYYVEQQKQKQHSSLKGEKMKYQSRLSQPKSLQKIRKSQKFENEPQKQKQQQINMSKAQSMNDNKLPKVKQHKIYRSQDQITKQVANKKKIFLEYLQKKKQQMTHRSAVG